MDFSVDDDDGVGALESSVECHWCSCGLLEEFVTMGCFVLDSPVPNEDCVAEFVADSAFRFI